MTKSVRDEETGSAPAPVSDLRRMTHQDLKDFGMSKLAYVKPVTYEGEAAFAIHAADGTPMALAEDQSSAFEAIIDHEMVPAWVH
ncbi:DUF1150 family protein [Swaminathania salitolerans]|uniref:DUF1150 domain-containing protein n=1 Tax=Swaminathania salitolerans TaxID=182838 RepID=A0A511BM89_9PROT|nr:DUF1150 family protein [Swaminathania salitolerans]GBQ15691.1 hypothetical protein AA21291_2261 [Swaminathania salitolerans LMG 21291]GEL01450.1 hypothetical protein SSA02_06130 [Swaminathania salitolerans]